METFWANHGNVGNGLAHRLEALAGACGASFWSKSSREVRNGHIFSFSRSFRKLEKWEKPKVLLAIRSELFLGGWNRSGVNRWPDGCAMSGKRPGPPRKVRVLQNGFAGYPIFDLARFGLQGPRVCPARRGTMVLGDRKTLGYSGTLRGNPPVS